MSVVRSRVKYSKLKDTADFEDKDENTKAPSVPKPQKPARKAKKPSKDDFHDDQFEDTVPIRAPVKSICIAIILFVLGTIMLTVGSLMLAGVIGYRLGSYSPGPLMVIGSIIFIPGAYNVRTAYYAWKGYHGFSFADIAGFGEDQ